MKVRKILVSIGVIIFLMPIGLFLLAGIFYGLFNLPGFIEQRILESRINEKLKVGNEVFLKDVTWFEWDKVCRQDGYMDGSTSPYVWELIFYKNDEQVKLFEFIQASGSNMSGKFCKYKASAVLLKQGNNYRLSGLKGDSYAIDFSRERQHEILSYREVVDVYYKDFNSEVIRSGNRFNPEINTPFDVYDLNGDGTKEIITKAADATVCGNYDCGCSILLKKESGWENIISDFWCYDGDTYILSDKTNGFHDLAIKGFRDWIGKTRIWKWNGKEYKYSHHILEN